VGAGLGGLLLVCPVVEPDLAVRRPAPQRYAVRTADLTFESDEERSTFDGEVAVHTKEVLDAFRRHAAPAHAATDRAFLSGVRSRYALSLLLRTAAKGLAVPTAVVCARDDAWSGFLDAAELAAAIPRSALTVVPDTGPLLPLEAPARLRALATDWLDRVEADERSR
jgi:pimeloyl-ACP methyl ester carboxylesterase